MAIKTTLLLLVALLLVCCRDRGATPTVSSASVDSRDPRNASGEADARQSESATSEAAAQTQKVELWDANDELHVADRMLERVKQEGVVRIASVRASRDKYVFVGEFEETWQFVPTQQPRLKTDLWLVNKNGTGLQRLTDDGESYDPEWLPSGDAIVFVNSGSISAIVEVITASENGSTPPHVIVLYAGKPSGDGRDISYVEYLNPKLSRDGNLIAALAKDGTSGWVIATPINGVSVFNFAKGAEGYQWSSNGDLILDYGTLVHDLERRASNPRPPNGSDANEPNLTSGEDPGGEPELLKRLLNKVSRCGVTGIDGYSIASAAGRVVFAGGFEAKNGAWESDLWLVNRDGRGLRRLTQNGHSSQPQWSPNGKEIAFVSGGSINVIEVKSRKVRRLPDLQACDNGDEDSCTYADPRWSPNGKALAARGVGDPELHIAVEARSGREILSQPHNSHAPVHNSWNNAGELILCDHGKFVFDWNSALFKRH